MFDGDSVARARRLRLSGKAYRQQAPKYDPRSGARYQYEIALDDVIDLTDAATVKSLDLAVDDLVCPDWRVTQELGTLAHHLGCQAVLAPSATGVDAVLAVFVENIGLGVVEPRLLEVWESEPDV